MRTRTLIIEVQYNEDLTVSSAHAMTSALAEGEGVVRVRARLAPPDYDLSTMFTRWDSMEIGPEAGKPVTPPRPELPLDEQ